jgi:Benzoyl-CoA reductase/2-hydroxyglutaryl-CoA dehydratase subunit, BcrC/BadD/HgdB
MSSIQGILNQMKAAYKNPTQTVADYKAKTGKGAVGCIAPYTPEEMVHAAGYLPIGLWGGQVELNRVRAVLPAFACSIMQSVKELELTNRYDILSAVICPSACDTLKAIGQKWTRKDTPMIQFVHPHNRKLPAAVTFLSREYQSVRERLEAAIGERISDEAINRSIDIYNAQRKVMREFGEVAADYPDLIDPIDRHVVFKSAFFMRKEDHAALVSALIDLLKTEPKKEWDGLKVVVSGIAIEPDSVLEIFKEMKLAIVADDLAQESRQCRVDAPEGTCPLERMAKQWQNMYGCSLAYEHEKTRVPMLRELYEQKKADAVIVAMMKFCDPEEFDYPMIKTEMETNSIPLLQLEIDQQIQSVEQLRTRLQSFVEMIGQR